MIPYVTCFIENQEGKFLLQLRDNNPNIFYPNCWGPFGGSLEKGETFKDALVREIKEEISVDLSGKKLSFLFDVASPERVGIAFHVKTKLNPEDIILNEGQEARFFTPDEIKAIPGKVPPEIEIFRTGNFVIN